MKNIIHQKLSLPRQAPVMVLPQVMLFPAAMLPLFIFEPRYRAMLAATLERDRMFCVAPTKPDVMEPSSNDDFHHIVGLGLVRACRGHEDGTSHLVLQGIARVRLTRFVQDTPYRIAEIRELASEPVDPAEAQSTMTKLRELCKTLQSDTSIFQSDVNQQLAKIHDPELLSDIIAHTFLRDPERRQEVFEILDVHDRMRMLEACLELQMEQDD